MTKKDEFNLAVKFVCGLNDQALEELQKEILTNGYDGSLVSITLFFAITVNINLK